MDARVQALEETVGEVRERLASLETSVAAILEQQQKQTGELMAVRLMLAKWGGGFAVLIMLGAAVWAVVQLVINKFTGGPI